MPHRFMKPCLDCGQLSRNNRCDTHQAVINQKKERKRDTPERRAKKRTYYNADYQRRAKLVRQTATLCHLCGEGPRIGDPWEADHVYPGDPNSPLLPAHRTCNNKKSNRIPSR
jgi:hypothetical protein